ncbi:sugar-binding transcriptional regulator [uncultured Metabacillus sp.]|uniref:sugar-binding transcriptional regulator n=1 Tax=uncultured Metabacillus sp. TaxID=2860135 RepID=UPI00261ED5A4|nr:sugar-binding transcriptional regulator [uncultured Metabacillus sp.]
MLSWEERRQLVKTASLYYIEGLTQEQIAKRVGVSRPVISKHLQKAKEYGIVEVFIKDESLHTVELENKLETRFNLKDAVVVPNTSSKELSKKAVGQAAANYVSKNLKRVKKIGISWGTTLAEFVKEYPFERREHMKIVPLVGGMGSQHVEIHANQLAYELAKKMNAACSYLYVPAFIESGELKERLVDMTDVKYVLEEGKNVDMAIVGIGNPYHDSILEKIGYLTAKELEEFKKVETVGDISSRFVDINGRLINHPINDKVIGITLEELKEIDDVIAVAEGLNKVESILGALNSHCLDVLIIDESTAAALLERVGDL